MHQSTRGKRRNSNKMQKFRRRNLRLNWLKQPQVTWTGGGERRTSGKRNMTSVCSNEHGIHCQDGFLLWEGERKWWRFKVLKNQIFSSSSTKLWTVESMWGTWVLKYSSNYYFFRFLPFFRPLFIYLFC